jgi:hypothetical protein
MIVAEKLVSQNYPVYNYRYASDPKNPLRFYDCLTPALREHVRIPVELYNKTFVEDFKLRLDLKHAEEATVSFHFLFKL